VVGRERVTQEHYYKQYVTSFMKPESLNVLTIHAEVEGMSCLDLFREFLEQLRIQGGNWVPLGQLLPPADQIPGAVIGRQKVEGREGWVSVQQSSGEAR
jgi:undecaprenyl phosphate-alpha-L-ara4FN deformylase